MITPRNSAITPPIAIKKRLVSRELPVVVVIGASGFIVLVPTLLDFVIVLVIPVTLVSGRIYVFSLLEPPTGLATESSVT